MRKTVIIILSLMLSMSMMAQKSIQLRSVDKAECVKSDMTSLKASFSFSSIETQDYSSERGTFSWLSLANTVIGYVAQTAGWNWTFLMLMAACVLAIFFMGLTYKEERR